jgi:hypothetical protein
MVPFEKYLHRIRSFSNLASGFLDTRVQPWKGVLRENTLFLINPPHFMPIILNPVYQTFIVRSRKGYF